LDDKGWSLADEHTQAVLDKIVTNGTPLWDYADGKIYLGVLTGLDKAFIIDGETKNNLIEKDSKSKDLIVPFLKGKDIKRYQPPVYDRYLILLPRGWTREKLNTSHNAFNSFVGNYPAIADYLLPFAEAAEKRSKSNKGEYWWELRACGYYDEFKKPKILWPEIAGSARFTFDLDQAYTNHKVYIIPRRDFYLLGLLNSALLRLFIHSVCTDLQGNSFNFSVAFVGRTPIRTIDFSDPEDVSRHDLMVQLVENMLELNKKLAEPIQATRRSSSSARSTLPTARSTAWFTSCTTSPRKRSRSWRRLQGKAPHRDKIVVLSYSRLQLTT